MTIPASDIAVTLFDGTSHATIGWDPGDDADLPDGFPGSGVQSYSYSYRTNGGEWTAWATTDDSSFAVDAPGGSTVDVEAQDIDGAGSTSASATGSVVIGSPTPPQDETDTSASPVAGIQADEPVPDTLPPAPIPMTPDGRAPAGSYAVDYSPASEQGVDGGLAIVTSTATGTAALTGAVVNAQTGKPIITATASLALPPPILRHYQRRSGHGEYDGRSGGLQAEAPDLTTVEGGHAVGAQGDSHAQASRRHLWQRNAPHRGDKPCLRLTWRLRR